MKKIFLIDDDPVFVYLTRKIISMTRCSCEISEFGDGELAIGFISNIAAEPDAQPDIIFLDINMPVMDGWEFLRQFTAIRPSLKNDITLYIVSSSISPQDIERSRTFSVVSDFLVKPLGKARVAEIISAHH